MHHSKMQEHILEQAWSVSLERSARASPIGRSRSAARALDRAAGKKNPSRSRGEVIESRKHGRPGARPLSQRAQARPRFRVRNPEPQAAAEAPPHPLCLAAEPGGRPDTAHARAPGPKPGPTRAVEPLRVPMAEPTPTPAAPPAPEPAPEPPKRAIEMTVEQRAAALREIAREHPAACLGLSLPRRSPWR